MLFVNAMKLSKVNNWIHDFSRLDSFFTSNDKFDLHLKYLPVILSAELESYLFVRMNEEPPEELATVVRKNADISVRTRLQQLCDTIVSDSTGTDGFGKYVELQKKFKYSTILLKVYPFKVI